MTADGTRVERIAQLATDRGVTIATSESLTSGVVATRLGEGPDAAQWFRGGVIAYQESVKFDLLGVPEGPVVTAECAEQMASGARTLLGADVVVSATGVGGPEPSEGKPPGTVFLAVETPWGATVRELALSGDPSEVLETVASESLALLEHAVEADAVDR